MGKKRAEAQKRQVIINELSRKIGDRCWYCGQRLYWGEMVDLDRISIDHITPKSKGGGEDVGNYALICGACNRAKSGADIVTFLKWLAHIRSSRFSCFILSRLDSRETGLLGTDGDSLRKDFF